MPTPTYPLSTPHSVVAAGNVSSAPLSQSLTTPTPVGVCSVQPPVGLASTGSSSAVLRLCPSVHFTSPSISCALSGAHTTVGENSCGASQAGGALSHRLLAMAHGSAPTERNTVCQTSGMSALHPTSGGVSLAHSPPQPSAGVVVDAVRDGGVGGDLPSNPVTPAQMNCCY